MEKGNNIISLQEHAEKTAEDLPLAQRDDDSLMLLVRAGVIAAFDEIVRRHQRKVLRIASKYLGDASRARDVAQTVFLEVFRSLPRYKAHGRFEAYLYRVLITQCHMTFRSSKYEDRLRQSFQYELPDSPEVPEAQILAQERRNEVERCVRKLSKKLRAVIVLRFGGDLSYQEIAEVLEIPVGTAKRRVFDALEKMRRDLEIE